MPNSATTPKLPMMACCTWPLPNLMSMFLRVSHGSGHRELDGHRDQGVEDADDRVGDHLRADDRPRDGVCSTVGVIVW